AMASPSAWTAKALGGTTSSSSGCGAASSTRRCICGPTQASERREIRSAGISNFTTAEDRIRALTATHRIKPTSPRCLSAGQPNLGRCSTYQRGDFVQTIGTSSLYYPQCRTRHSFRRKQLRYPARHSEILYLKLADLDQ